MHDVPASDDCRESGAFVSHPSEVRQGGLSAMLMSLFKSLVVPQLTRSWRASEMHRAVDSIRTEAQTLGRTCADTV